MPHGPDDRAAAPPPPARRLPGGPAKGDRRRQAILEAVERLLHERSIAELSVEDIAAAAGISRSGFYFYFQNKYAALGDALTDIADAMIGAADAFFVGSERPPEAYVREALAGVAALWHEHVALMSGIVDAAHSDPGARALWDAWRSEFIDRIARQIEGERTAGRAPTTALPARDLARGLLVLNLGMLYDDGRRRAADTEVQRSVDTLASIWLASVWGVTAGH